MLIYNIERDKQSWNIMKYFIPSSKLKKKQLINNYSMSLDSTYYSRQRLDRNKLFDLKKSKKKFYVQRGIILDSTLKRTSKRPPFVSG